MDCDTKIYAPTRKMCLRISKKWKKWFFVALYVSGSFFIPSRSCLMKATEKLSGIYGNKESG